MSSPHVTSPPHGMSARGSRVRQALVEIGPLTALMAVCVWTVMLFAQLQAPGGDYGIFVSVAERLKAGDRLYLDVWNNRDPLFYFTLATSRWITPFGGWLLEIARLFLISLASYLLARSLGVSRRVAVLTGFVCAPIVATAIADPATGVPPGVAIAMLAIAALLRQRLFLSGLLVGWVLFFKVTQFPIALSAIVVAAIVLRIGREGWRIVAGAAVAVASVVLLLALRGELIGYLDSIRLNLLYSQEGQAGQAKFAFIEHLSRSLTWTSQVTLVATVTVLFLALAASRSTPKWHTDVLGAALVWAGGVSVVTAVVVLSITGKWPGHAKLLIIPALLALIVMIGRGPDALRDYRVSPMIAIFGMVILISGLPAVRPYLTQLEYARGNLNQQWQVSKEGSLILQSGEPSTYARVGQGDDPGHAIGLGQWRLVCPRFQQYWWEPDELLNQSLDCLPKAKVIVVAPSANRDVNSPTWDRYLTGVEELLARDYDCRDSEGTRVCVRRDAT